MLAWILVILIALLAVLVIVKVIQVLFGLLAIALIVIGFFLSATVSTPGSAAARHTGKRAPVQ